MAAPFRGLAGKSDNRLVELAQRGDTHAIEVLYDRYATAILRYCRSLLRSTQEAEDVQQEVFVTALSALRNGAGPESFRPWLYRVAHNACISHMRAKRPTLAAVDGELVASATTEPASEEREELRQLLDDLGGLPEVQRGALLLREMDGFSYEQVGEVLGLPVTTVRSTIFRARSTLQGLAEARDAKCSEIQAELSELADRRGRRSRRITSHLRVCSDCRDFRVGLRNRPTVLRGFVPALPVGVLATVKAAALGAHGGAGSATAAAGAGAGASGGLGLLGGAGAGKLVAAAASACVLIGGAGTQVGVLGGQGDAGNGPASSPLVATQEGGDGGAAPRRGAGAGEDLAASAPGSGAVPVGAAGVTTYAAPGTVVWRPADGRRGAHGNSVADGSHDDDLASAGNATVTGSRPPGTVTMSQWGNATPGAYGPGAGSWLEEPDDNSDDYPVTPGAADPAPRSDRDSDSDDTVRRTSSSDDRDDRRTTTLTAPGSGDSTRGGDEDRRTAGSGDSEAPSGDQSPAATAAPEQGAAETGATQPASAPSSDPPAQDTTAKEPAPSAPTSDSGSTTTAPADPAPDASTTSTAPTSTAPAEPAPAPDPAPTTP